MGPDLACPSFADHPAIRGCLEAHGFKPTGASRFSNGRATVHFDGAKLTAAPAHGSRVWRSEIRTATPEAVVGLLQVVLASAPFLSQEEIDRRLARTHAAKIALHRLVEAIREEPDTPRAQSLRRFLWSLFNNHHQVNLWNLKAGLDRQRAAWIHEIFTAWLDDLVSDEAMRQALKSAGEFDRSVSMPPGASGL